MTIFQDKEEPVYNAYTTLLNDDIEKLISAYSARKVCKEELLDLVSDLQSKLRQFRAAVKIMEGVQ